MKHASQSDFGRLDSVVQSSWSDEVTADKWALLAALTKAADLYEVNHRSLHVLKALLTFWPDRDLRPERGACVVFPSNRTLSDRLNGMPESTLRRHLARLVELGIITRQNSANRKRFARRTTEGTQIAYGFDLSPLACHAEHLLSQAKWAERQKQHLTQLRDQVASLRQQLIEDDLVSDLVEQSRLALRRKPDAEQLTLIASEMKAELDRERQTSPAPCPTVFETVSAKMSATDDQNERHIQDSNKQDSDSEEANDLSSSIAIVTVHKTEHSKEEIGLSQVLSACSETRSFFPDPIRSWEDLYRTAARLAPMLGIDQPVLIQAAQTMGRLPAAISVLCILERSADIRSPGAYLRKLSQKAAQGGFSILPMLKALKNRGPKQNCQLTI